MSLVGRAIGLFVLCVLVGLFLETIGISARGILNDTWYTIGAVFRRLVDLLDWAARRGDCRATDPAQLP
jgi:hypothetical protein